MEDFVLDAIHADQLISDEEAEKRIVMIEHAPVEADVSLDSNDEDPGKLYEVNLDTICENFNNGEVVDIDSLKARGIIPEKAGKIKILARGIMTKRLTVIADKYSIQAVKMISLAGGEVDQYK